MGIGGGYGVDDDVVHVVVSLGDDGAVGLIEDWEIRTLKERQGRVGGAADNIDGESEFGGVGHGSDWETTAPSMSGSHDVDGCGGDVDAPAAAGGDAHDLVGVGGDLDLESWG